MSHSVGEGEGVTSRRERNRKRARHTTGSLALSTSVRSVGVSSHDGWCSQRCGTICGSAIEL